MENYSKIDLPELIEKYKKSPNPKLKVAIQDCWYEYRGDGRFEFDDNTKSFLNILFPKKS